MTDEEYYEFIQPYEDAKQMLLTRLDGMEYFPVEIQFRTMSMDFWASMEHRISYKKERADKEQLKDELREYANMLVEIEGRFEQYNETDHQLKKYQSK